MSSYKTVQDVLDFVEAETDTEAEDFVSQPEIISYIRQAVDIAQKEVHKLGREDVYFEKRALFSLVSGQQEYVLPTDLYANKVKKIIYSTSQNVYEVKRFRNVDRYEVASEIEQNSASTGDSYQYFLVNQTVDSGVTVRFYPTPMETGASMVIWYIRQANEVTLPVDKIDILESFTFICKYVKWKILDKDTQGNAISADADQKAARQDLVDVLNERVPDEDNTIPPDTYIMEEHS